MAVGITKIVCVSCRKSLTEAQRTSGGTCPKCKHRGDNAVDAVEVLFVFEIRYPWYQKLWRFAFG